MKPQWSPAADSVTIAATVASADALLPGSTGTAMRIYNGGTAVVFIRWGIAGAGTQVAVLTDTFVAPGGTEIFSIPQGSLRVAVILAAATGNVSLQRGDGQ